MSNTEEFEEFGCSDEEYGKCCWPRPCRVDRRTRALPQDLLLEFGAKPVLDKPTPEQEIDIARYYETVAKYAVDSVRAVAWRAIPIGKENARSGRWIGEHAGCWAPVSIRHEVRELLAAGIVLCEERDTSSHKGVRHYWREC